MLKFKEHSSMHSFLVEYIPFRPKGGLKGTTHTHKHTFPYLFDSIQHALASLPWFGVLPDAAQTGHAVPLPILQFSVKGIGQQQHSIIDVAVGDLQRERDDKGAEK